MSNPLPSASCFVGKTNAGVVIREQLRPDIVLLNTGLWKPLECVPGSIALRLWSVCAYCMLKRQRVMSGTASFSNSTHKNAIHSLTPRAGPQLDSVVQAAQGLHEHSAVDVYWKTTTSRAIGAAWVRVRGEGILHAFWGRLAHHRRLPTHKTLTD